MRIEINSDFPFVSCDGEECDPIERFKLDLHCTDCPIVRMCIDFKLLNY